MTDPGALERLKLLYLAPADIQIARVDRQCIVAFCAALKEIGCDVELVAIRIATLPSEPRRPDPLDLYRITTRFPARLVRVPATQRSPGWWLGLNRLVVHALAAAAAIRRRSPHQLLVLYTKSYSTIALLRLARSLLPKPTRVVFEAHTLPRGRLRHHLISAADRVVANSHALAHDLVEQGIVGAGEVLGMHQGIDLEVYGVHDRSAVRAELGLPALGRLVVYTGKIYDGYAEVDYILDAARLLAENKDVRFVLVGGRADHVERLRARARADGLENVDFVGFVTPALVPKYQVAADVLVLYYPSHFEINAYRSPGKLFEYMASGNPIVAVDLPVLKEVLGDAPAAWLVEPDSPPALAGSIEQALADRDESRRRAAEARRRVENFTWRRRAADIVDFVSA
jgi:glycosyltransferase involved in cell wall biosynthesis